MIKKLIYDVTIERFVVPYEKTTFAAVKARTAKQPLRGQAVV